jgi:hypothetical protein
MMSNAGLERGGEVVEPRRQPPPDIDEEGALLHFLKPHPVHEPLGLRSMRHGQDDETCPRQQRIEFVTAMRLGDPWRRFAAALVDADDLDSEGRQRALLFDAGARLLPLYNAKDI